MSIPLSETPNVPSPLDTVPVLQDEVPTAKPVRLVGVLERQRFHPMLMALMTFNRRIRGVPDRRDRSDGGGGAEWGGGDARRGVGAGVARRQCARPFWRECARAVRRVLRVRPVRGVAPHAGRGVVPPPAPSGRGHTSRSRASGCSLSCHSWRGSGRSTPSFRFPNRGGRGTSSRPRSSSRSWVPR